MSNAVKYGGEARWLRVSAGRAASNYFVRERRLGSRAFQVPAVEFMVEDRGLGIPSEDRKHIFEPFYRGRDAVARQIQGSGLGLHLVQRIAEAHHGTVTVESEPGRGSVFTLTLPAMLATPAKFPVHSRQFTVPVDRFSSSDSSSFSWNSHHALRL